MEIKYNFGNEFLVIDEKDDPGQIDLVTLSNVRRIMIDYKIFDQKGLKKTDVEIINLLTDINLVTDLEELALTWINITKLPIFIKRFNKLKKIIYYKYRHRRDTRVSELDDQFGFIADK